MQGIWNISLFKWTVSFVILASEFLSNQSACAAVRSCRHIWIFLNFWQLLNQFGCTCRGRNNLQNVLFMLSFLMSSLTSYVFSQMLNLRSLKPGLICCLLFLAKSARGHCPRKFKPFPLSYISILSLQGKLALSIFLGSDIFKNSISSQHLPTILI